jgi:hypothetical protein
MVGAVRPLIASLAVAVVLLAVALIWIVRSGAPPSPHAPPPTPAREESRTAVAPLPPPIEAQPQMGDAADADTAKPKLPLDLGLDLARLEVREPVAPPPDLDALARQIERAPEAERGSLVLQYLEAAHALPPEQQTAALERLNTLLRP